jgi:hypothetical protein
MPLILSGNIADTTAVQEVGLDNARHAVRPLRSMTPKERDST